MIARRPFSYLCLMPALASVLHNLGIMSELRKMLFFTQRPEIRLRQVWN